MPDALGSHANDQIDTTEPEYDKANEMTCAFSEDLDQPGRPPSLIRVFAVHPKVHPAKTDQPGRPPSLI